MARSVQSWCRCYANAEMADWNALMWAPVRIRVWLDLVQFQFRPFRDPTAQQQLARWHMAPLSSQRGRAWSVFSKGNTVPRADLRAARQGNGSDWANAYPHAAPPHSPSSPPLLARSLARSLPTPLYLFSRI